MVAAVAGLAAIAVVLVQGVVGTTAEQVASHSARQEAAELAASVIHDEWRAEAPADADEAGEINRIYGRRCGRLAILYRDIELRPEPKPGTFAEGPPPGWGRQPGCTIR